MGRLTPATSWRVTLAIDCGRLSLHYNQFFEVISVMSKFQPDGWHTVTPRIIVRDPESLITFIKHVFHGQGEFRPGLPAEIRIGDSVVMISDGGSLREPALAYLYVYVEDTDSTYARAMAANAVSIEAPADMPYGDRRATVKDLWGNTWQIATPKDAR